jgi:hypothetical protein
MPWVKVDDHFDEHLKHARVGPPGWGYWLAGLAYCNRNLTDGFIPYSVAYSLAGWQVWDDPVDDHEGRERIWTYGVSSGMSGEDLDGNWIVTRLVTAGLWEPVVGGFLVHDYLDYNPSRAQVLEERLRVRGRVQRHRNAGGSAGGNSVSNGGVTPAPVPVPVPSAQKTSSSSHSQVRVLVNDREGLPHITAEVQGAGEAITGSGILTAGDKQLTELDRLVETHGADAVIGAFREIGKGTWRQLVWGAMKRLEPIPAAPSTQESRKAEAEEAERRRWERSLAENKRRREELGLAP